MPDVTLQEAKAALDGLLNSFEEHKKTVNQRIDALAKGHSTAELDQKLARISEDMDKKQQVQVDYMKAIEAKLNRLALGDSVEGTEGAEAKAHLKSLNTFLRGGVEQLSVEERKSLINASDTGAGFLAPAQFDSEIIKAEVLFSPVRTLVRVKPMGGVELKQPKRTGTASATRVGERGTRTETTNPSYGLVTINAPELYAEARVSQQHLEDSAYNVEAELAMEFGEQFGVREGYEFVNGTGINQMLGILDANAAGPSTPISFTVSGSAATIAGAAGAQADGIIDLFYAVKTAYAQRGTWCLNRQSLGKVRKLKDTQGRFLWEPSTQVGTPSSILGAPVCECPDFPDEAANAFPIGFGDWQRAYTMGDRVGVTITRDPFTLASDGLVKFTARKRVGGQVVLGEAIRLLKCSA
jgi:HK97 family phage major capsid protein